MVLSDWVGILKAFFTLLKANVKKSSSFLGSRCIIKSISEERRRCEFPHSQGENLASKDPVSQGGRLSHSEVSGGCCSALSWDHLVFRCSSKLITPTVSGEGGSPRAEGVQLNHPIRFY